jgi:hypothetical protein
MIGKCRILVENIGKGCLVSAATELIEMFLIGSALFGLHLAVHVADRISHSKAFRPILNDQLDSACLAFFEETL